jgi:hypothetical protein
MEITTWWERGAGHTDCINEERNFRNRSTLRRTQMKGIGLWLLGVPVIVIVALYVFGIM